MRKEGRKEGRVKETMTAITSDHDEGACQTERLKHTGCRSVFLPDPSHSQDLPFPRQIAIILFVHLVLFTAADRF